MTNWKREGGLWRTRGAWRVIALATICAALGAVAGAYIRGAVGSRVVGGGVRACDPGVPGLGTRRVSLESAMRTAIAEVSPEVGEESKERWGRLAVAYWELLARGETVIVAYKPFRGMTLAFAGNLPGKHREEWLRGCMAVGQERDARARVQALLVAHMLDGGPRLGPMTNRCDILEAVYNVTREPATKVEALNRWNALEWERYDLEMERDKRRGSKDARRGAGLYVPRLRAMPEWGEEKIPKKGVDRAGAAP